MSSCLSSSAREQIAHPVDAGPIAGGRRIDQVGLAGDDDVGRAVAGGERGLAETERGGDLEVVTVLVLAELAQDPGADLVEGQPERSWLR